MNLAGEMQFCMVSLDVGRAREVWKLVFPHLPPITSDAQMLATLHLARTQSPVVNERLRFYSHRWLSERGLPTALPDELKPKAERLYPRRASGVGISVNAMSDLFRPIVDHVRVAMEDAVKEVYADGNADDIPLIKRRMREAHRSTVRRLLGKC